MTVVRFRNVLFLGFLIWIFLSAFYYAPNLIDGQLLTDRSENLLHKATNYFVVMTFALLYAISEKDVRFFTHGLIWSGAIVVLGILFLAGYNVIFGLEMMFMLMSFYGLSHFSANFNCRQIIFVINAVVYSAFIISILSYFEYVIFEPILGDFWINTGGFRSVSTLLNPNNFGIYVGAALILLIFSEGFKIKRKIFLCGVIMGAFYLSGSRTAWVSFVISVFMGVTYKGGWEFDFKAWFYSLFIGVLLLVQIAFLLFFQLVDLPERAVDFYTAYVRIEKYFNFLIGIDTSYLYPDFYENRIEMVSESGYFHFINAVGFVNVLIILVPIFLFFRLGWLANLFRVSSARSFGVLFFYYSIASLFENVLMSFPNNQLIFISIGVTVAAWRMKPRFLG